jgi:poly(A) polymerase
MQLNFTTRETELLQLVAQSADDLQIEAFAVGGFVRDKILNRDCKDIDVVCVGSGIELAQKVADNYKLQYPETKHFARCIFQKFRHSTN